MEESGRTPDIFNNLRIPNKGRGGLNEKDGKMAVISPATGGFKDDIGLMVRGKAFHQKQLANATPPQQTQNQPLTFGLNIKVKQPAENPAVPQPQAVKDDFVPVFSVKRPHDICDGPIPNRVPNTGINLKMVMDVTRGFNEGCEQNNDIRLDTQEIDPSDMKKENFVDVNGGVPCRGSFGSVFPMTIKSGKQIMVKEFVRQPHVKVDHNEIQMPMGLPGNGIVKMFGVKCFGDRLWILMEDAGKSLKWWLVNRGDDSDDRFRCWSKVPENLANISLQLFKILRILEMQRIAHRDIKPENLCVSLRCGRWVFTLVDFGSAQPSQEKAVLAGHTTEYLPPQLNHLIYLVKTGQPYHLSQDLFFDQKCDVWAVSMVILTISNCGFHPVPLVNKYSYEEDIQASQRMEVMRQIMRLTDQSFEPFLTRLAEPVQTALRNTLRLHRSTAWTGKQACCHLEGDGQRVVAKFQRLSPDMSSSHMQPQSGIMNILNGTWQKQQQQQQQFSILKPSAFLQPLHHPHHADGGTTTTISGKDIGIKLVLNTNPETRQSNVPTNPFAVTADNTGMGVKREQLPCVVEDVSLNFQAKAVIAPATSTPAATAPPPLSATSTKDVGGGLSGFGIQVKKQQKVVGMMSVAPAPAGGSSSRNTNVCGGGGGSAPTKIVGMGGPVAQQHTNQHRFINGVVRRSDDGCKKNFTTTPAVQYRVKPASGLVEAVLNKSSNNGNSSSSSSSSKMVGAHPATDEDDIPGFAGNGGGGGFGGGASGVGVSVSAHTTAGGIDFALPKLDLLLQDEGQTGCQQQRRPRKIAVGRRRSSNNKP